MEEFIEHFNEFKYWLFNQCSAYTKEEADGIRKVQNKFEELGLDKGF